MEPNGESDDIRLQLDMDLIDVSNFANSAKSLVVHSANI